MISYWRARARRARELARAQAALAAARIATWRLPPGRLVSLEPDRAMLPTPAERAQARRLASAVDRMAQLGPIRGPCLVRALALQRLMRASGLEGSRLRIGVRPGDPGAIDAHAWVEFGGDRLGADGAQANSFSAFADVPEPPLRAVR